MSVCSKWWRRESLVHASHARFAGACVAIVVAGAAAGPSTPQAQKRGTACRWPLSKMASHFYARSRSPPWLEPFVTAVTQKLVRGNRRVALPIPLDSSSYTITREVDQAPSKRDFMSTNTRSGGLSLLSWAQHRSNAEHNAHVVQYGVSIHPFPSTAPLALIDSRTLFAQFGSGCSLPDYRPRGET